MNILWFSSVHFKVQRRILSVSALLHTLSGMIEINFALIRNEAMPIFLGMDLQMVGDVF